MASVSPWLALCFATIERPQVVQRLVQSVRRYFPDLPIYAADQSRHLAAMSSFYAENKVRVLHMPYDIGVTASRNKLAREIDADYFVLCDDDFILGPQTSFRDAVRILETHLEIGVVGGRLYDFGWNSNQERIRHWELFLQYDRQQKILFSIPIYELAPKVRQLGGVRFYLCDAVLNFAVFRRSMFAKGVQWDERFKSNGEHEDFYLNLKVNSSYRVAFLPTMVAYHHHPEEYRAYIARLRERNEGWRRFFEKWDLEQHVELGLGVRTIDDFDTVTAAQDARSRFFVNADLSLRRTEPLHGALVIRDFEHIETVGVLDDQGKRADPGPASGRLLVERDTNSLIAAPEPTIAERAERDAPNTRSVLLDRYGLEISDEDPAVSATNQEIYFRYDAILRPDADFYLWYRCQDGQSVADRSGRRLAMVVRWSAQGGRTLVWKSRPSFLDLRSTAHWRALRVEVPLLPRGVAWLRFDLITEGGANPYPICTGFLFAPRQAGNRSEQAADPAVFEVSGLNRLPQDGANPGVAGRLISEVARNCTRRQATLRTSGLAADMVLFRTDEIAGLEALFFVGWESLGRSLVAARLPGPALHAPEVIALPRAEHRAAPSQIFAYGSTIGFIALSVAVPDMPV
jgi:GT2 family glycosyltransferase